MMYRSNNVNYEIGGCVEVAGLCGPSLAEPLLFEDV